MGNLKPIPEIIQNNIFINYVKYVASSAGAGADIDKIANDALEKMRNGYSGASPHKNWAEMCDYILECSSLSNIMTGENLFNCHPTGELYWLQPLYDSSMALFYENNIPSPVQISKE